MQKSNKRLFALADLCLLLIAFVIAHSYQYGHLQVAARHADFLLYLVGLWLCQAVAVKKFSAAASLGVRSGVVYLSRQAVVLLLLVSLVVLALHLWKMSRVLTYGTIMVFAVLEIAAFVLYRRVVPAATEPENKALSLKDAPQSSARSLFILDGVLLAAAILISTWLKRGAIVFDEAHLNVFIALFGIWFAVTIGTGNFKRDRLDNFFHLCGDAFKCVFLMATGAGVILFAFRLGTVSRLQVLGALALFFVLELAVFHLYTSWRRYRGNLQDVEDIHEVQNLIKDASSDTRQSLSLHRPVEEPVHEKLKHALEFFNPELFSMIEQNIGLDKIDRTESALMDTENLFNLETLDKGAYRLLINLRNVNDIRWLNRYFILAYLRLQQDGYLVGAANTITLHREWFASRFPRPADSIFYFFSFLWYRVFPKLNWTKKIYFAITQGRGRMMAKAEVLGRLYFCGFELVAENESKDRYYFIARKSGRVSTDENPSYGMLVKLKRLGQGGKPIVVYKFRTMYPYSEFLQEYIYDRQNLTKGGKFRNDFRVTGWGRIFRRFWIDELPMLYNWLKGDMQLLGVRPLSAQYLSLYSNDLQQLRRLVKPGLLPPFYADMPETIEEIMQSEERYIRAFMEKPFTTQWRYFRRCVWNIVVKKARSG